MVTGGAGFIGSHLCDEVIKWGKHCALVDDLSTGLESNIPADAEFIKLNVDNTERLMEVMDGIDLVFHLAAQPSARRSIENPELDLLSNVVGTYSVLIAARATGVRKVVYTSSSAAYGEPEQLPMVEFHRPTPGTPYGASKLCGEHYCTAFAHVYELPCICLRPFNVYGARENLEISLDEVVRYMIAIMHGRPITVSGDGRQTRDFVHVSDVVRAHLLAADSNEAKGNVFNICTGQETSINELITILETETGRKANVKYEQWSEGDIKREYGDITLSGEILGYRPEIKLVDGIRALINETVRRTKTS